MDYYSALIYGAIQGLTEFLPVSSSGHLALLPHFLNIQDPGVVFDLAMHLGTALSIIVYFWSDVFAITKEAVLLLKFDKVERPKTAYVLNMIISTITTFVVALIFKGFAEAYGRAPELIAINLITFGVLMFISDFLGRKDGPDIMTEKKFKIAFSIGLFQAMAIFPGVSRSGSTLTISRFLQLTRDEATRYSFLLSLPVIIAGFILKLPEFFKNPNLDMVVCLVGMIVSFLVGLITIHFFLKVIKKLGLGIFSIYRVILGIIIFSLMIKL